MESVDKYKEAVSKYRELKDKLGDDHPKVKEQKTLLGLMKKERSLKDRVKEQTDESVVPPTNVTGSY